MTMLQTAIGAPSARNMKWEYISWKTAQDLVRRLQLRIAKAAREKRYGKVKALQWLLTHSFYAKLLAIRRVTQNRGKNTPGVDRITWKKPHQKMQAVKQLGRRGYRSLPLRRIYIPKKNGKLRPLGIPSMIDRCQQALHLLALEPIAETQADKNSYGFRPKRSIHDAIEGCFQALAKKVAPQWILEGDIKSCFDKISHEWLEKNIPMDKTILSQWLKAGYIDKNVFQNTEEGTPQGGIASPTLANMALDGLEKSILAIDRRGDKINFVRYADDWICTASSKEILEIKILPVITKFLQERGLELSTEKTKITHIEEGFDFLGFNLRKYKGKLLIKPAKRGIETFLSNIRDTISSKRNASAELLIKLLNPKIQGWANHHRHQVSKKIYNYIDGTIFWQIWKWAKRRHPNKNASWVREKYFKRIGMRNWCFYAKRRDKNAQEKILTLKSASETRIVRHIKIRSEANPHDPKFKEYFIQREHRRQQRAAGSDQAGL